MLWLGTDTYLSTHNSVARISHMIPFKFKEAKKGNLTTGQTPEILGGWDP